MALPDIKDRLATLGFDSIASSPEEFGEQIRDGHSRAVKCRYRLRCPGAIGTGRAFASARRSREKVHDRGARRP
jgi:hypothetical protein